MSVTWLLAAAAEAQDAPASAPTVPPGYSSSVSVTASAPAVLGQGVPFATPATPAAGPRVELREHTESIRGVWIPGLIVLPISWILTWSVASTTTRLEGDAIEFSYIPIIGPWLMLGQPMNGEEAYYVLAGIFQGASALALVLGLAIRRTVREQVWVTGALAALDALDVDVALAPLPGGGSASATVVF